MSRRRPIPELDIVALWEDYGGAVVGPDRSEWRKAKCPLHEDGTASAVVNEDERAWKCFTCDVGGDAIQLIMEVKGVGFVDALRIAEDIAARGGAAVSQQRSRSSLLPGRSGGKREGRRFVPPWLRG